MRKIFAWIFSIIGLVYLFLGFRFSITGEVVGSLGVFYNIYFFIGVLLLIISLIIYTMGKSLEAIVIPTAGSREVDLRRADTAYADYQINHLDDEDRSYFLITGVIDRDGVKRPIKGTSQSEIYQYIRRKDTKDYQDEGLKAKDMTSSAH